jgi:hypothetical protein
MNRRRLARGLVSRSAEPHYRNRAWMRACSERAGNARCGRDASACRRRTQTSAASGRRGSVATQETSFRWPGSGDPPNCAPELRGCTEAGAFGSDGSRGRGDELCSWRISGRGHQGDDSPALRLPRYFCNPRWEQPPRGRCLLVLVVPRMSGSEVRAKVRNAYGGRSTTATVGPQGPAGACQSGVGVREAPCAVSAIRLIAVSRLSHRDATRAICCWA